MNTCRRCGTSETVLDGWCDPCFAQRVEALTRALELAPPEQATGVFVRGMRELGEAQETIDREVLRWGH